MVKSSRGLIRMPTSIKTTPPEAARALELAWQRRRRELPSWQPTAGWLDEPKEPRVTSTAVVTERTDT